MNILKGFAKDIVIRFTADTAKASREIDKLGKKASVVAGGAGASLGEKKDSMLWGYPWAFGGFGMGAPLGDPQKQLRQVNHIKETNKTLGKTTDRFASLRQGLNSSLLPLGQFAGLLKALPGWLKASIVSILGLKSTFHYGNILEQSKMVLESIYDNEGMAVKTLKGMREFSRRTQFLPETIVGGTTMLAKYGVNPFEKGVYGLPKGNTAMDLMAGLAAMPGMGGAPIGLDRAINAAIAGRDIRPLKALGPEVLAAYQKAREAGISGSPEYIKVMLTELAKLPKILKLANAQMFTMSGMWSTITGYAEEIFMDISGADQRRGVLTFWSQLKEILLEIRNVGERVVERLQPFFRQFGVLLGSGFKVVFELVRSVFIILSPFLGVLKEVFKILFQIGIFFNQSFVKTLKFLVSVVEDVFRLFGVGGFVKKAIDMLYQFGVGLQVTFKFWGVYIDWLFEKVSKRLDEVFEKLKIFKPLWDLFTTGLRFISPEFDQYMYEMANPEVKAANERKRREDAAAVSNFFGKAWDSFIDAHLPFLKATEEQRSKDWGDVKKVMKTLDSTVKNLNRKLDGGGMHIVPETQMKNLEKKAPGRSD